MEEERRNGETWLGKDGVKLWKGQVEREVGWLCLKCPGTGHQQPVLSHIQGGPARCWIPVGAPCASPKL